MNNPMNIIVLIILCCSLIYAQEYLGEIQGQVVDIITGKPIPGAFVEIRKLDLQTTCDSGGNFEFKKIPLGGYNLYINSDMYKPVIITDVVVESGRTVQRLFKLEELKLGYIRDIVTPSAFTKPEDNSTSVTLINQEEVRRSPGTMEDAQRVVQNLPGVSAPADGHNDLIVRGGSPAENLTILDYIEVPNINHFTTQINGGGAINMLNTDAIREVRFLTGAFPAIYGDRLSSVLDIDLREGNKQKMGGYGELGVAGVGGLFEGPIKENKMSYLVSFRKSFLELVREGLDITAVPEYTNALVKGVYDINSNNKIGIIGFGGIDRIDVPADTVIAEDILNKGKHYVTGAYWKNIWRKGGYSVISVSRVYDYYYSDMIKAATGKRTFFNESDEGYNGIRYETSMDLSNKFSLGSALEGKNVFFNHHFWAEEDTTEWGNSRDETDIEKNISSFKGAASIQLVSRLSRRLTTITGLRGDYFSFTKKSAISPRVGTTYKILENFSVNGGYGIFQQAPPYVWMTGNPENTKLPYMRCDHYVAGVDYFPVASLKISIEGYLKKYGKLPVAEETPWQVLTNGGIDDPFVFDRIIPEGTASSRGIEFFAQKKLFENYYFIASYTLSKSRFKGLDGIERPGVFDFGNMINLVLGWKPFRWLETSTKWRYNGGGVYTPFDEEASRRAGTARYDTTRILKEKYPPYHRLDIRADFRKSFSGFNFITFIDCWNVYDRKNVFMYYWSEEKNKSIEMYQFARFIYGGIGIEF
ncbi:MAG: TonB-dependent receptor [Candidatus Coatesbacteria bacterium]|nr:TonB-dependent receptor [Candidatus Coatesbacteria bacterium]